MSLLGLQTPAFLVHTLVQGDSVAPRTGELESDSILPTLPWILIQPTVQIQGLVEPENSSLLERANKDPRRREGRKTSPVNVGSAAASYTPS